MTSGKTGQPGPRTVSLLSRRRRWIFRLLALSIPLLSLAIGEIICRFSGYGGYPPVLRKLGTLDGRAYYGSNQRGLSTFFFQNLTVPGSMEEQVFTMPKDPGTVRIFVLGGSAARGFPQPRTLAASSFLQAMLEDVWEDRRVEVLNLGTTALASFPLMYILDEVLELDPDLIIVYSGNNEFYGAHGVASVHAFGQSTRAMRAFRLLRRSAVAQWLTDLVTRRPPQRAPGERGRTLMERVIADHQIAPDDGRRAAAARNLKNHLTHVVERCDGQGVPVMVSTLPANERGLAPIGEDVRPSLGEEQRNRFERLLEQGRGLASDDPAAALAALTSAAALYDEHAGMHFLMGRCLTALGRHQEALTEYTLAKDLDTMPWRPPGACNRAVRRAAEQGAILCDLESEFRKNSAGGAIGWELMDDHVHPSLAGQALIAAAWLRSMAELPGPVRVDPADVRLLGPWEAYAQRLGANLYDRYGVANRMLHLFEAPFFRKNNLAALQRFEPICNEYEAQMSPAVWAAVRRWQDPNVHRGGHRPITSLVGLALMEEGDYEQADALLSIARRAVPIYSIWNLKFTWQALECRRRLRRAPLPEDLALAREMIANGETFMRVTGVGPPPIHRYVGLAYNLLELHEPAIRHLGEAVRYVQEPQGLVVIRALTESLVKTGQIDKARHLLQMPVRHPQLREACRALLAEIDAEAP